MLDEAQSIGAAGLWVREPLAAGRLATGRRSARRSSTGRALQEFDLRALRAAGCRGAQRSSKGSSSFFVGSCCTNTVRSVCKR